jgi:hypothetical protein
MVFDRGIGGRIRATITAVKYTVVIFIAILGVADQATGQDAQRCATSRPAGTFNGAQASADQAADKAANWPGTLIQGGSAIAVGRATGQQAAKQQNR